LIEVHDLPALNAALNSVATLLLVAGHLFVRRGRIDRHRLCMGAALVVSALFLASYVAYHLQAGSVRFTAGGWPRAAYYAILVTHVPLAAAILPLALVTAARGLRGRIEAHVRIARWTWPLWLYVSVTGVLIYLMLYQWFPSSEVT
jgi:putative membrane protein